MEDALLELPALFSDQQALTTPSMTSICALLLHGPARSCRGHRQVSLAWNPAPRQQLSRRCSERAVQAAAKRSLGTVRKSKKSRELDEAAQFEQLMCDWDDAFTADCCDTEKAALMARLAGEGHREHGRGFVFVQSRLDKCTRRASASCGSAGKGFGAAPKKAAEKGTPLETNPELHLLSWAACYIPGSKLDSLAGLFTTQDGLLLPDSGSLLVGGGSSSSSNSGSVAESMADLQRVLRGQDLSQLRGYIGMPPSSRGEAAEAAAEELGMAGIRRYEPQSGELVVLLAAKIGGRPAVGAELLVVARKEDGSTSLELPDGWEELLAVA